MLFEVCVFVAIEERGGDVISEEICRQCNGKQQEGGVAAEVCSSQTGMNKVERQNIIALTWVTKMKSLSWGNISTSSHQHLPAFQREAMRVSAKPLQSGWVGIGRWVWVTKRKKIKTRSR